MKVGVVRESADMTVGAASKTVPIISVPAPMPRQTQRVVIALIFTLLF